MSFNQSTFVLAVSDLARSKDFYVNKLGFNVWIEVPGWCFLRRDKVIIRLGHCPDALPMTKCPDHAWFAYIEITDIDDFHEQCVGNGVEIWHPVESRSWEMREFSIVTVDGHRIVFGESLL